VNYTMKSRPANRGSEFTLLVHHPAVNLRSHQASSFAG
jgi:hypothetical protein